MLIQRVALIGSFKQRYSEVMSALNAFRQVGIEVTSPLGAAVLKEGINFVRFESDDANMSDASVQSVTLRRIFSADLVYVVAPEGYVGRTTCYEIGRVLQAGIPIYFSERPTDLPIQVPASHIMNLTSIVDQAQQVAWKPSWPFAMDMDHSSELERELVTDR